MTEMHPCSKHLDDGGFDRCAWCLQDEVANLKYTIQVAKEVGAEAIEIGQRLEEGRELLEAENAKLRLRNAVLTTIQHATEVRNRMLRANLERLYRLACGESKEDWADVSTDVAEALDATAAPTDDTLESARRVEPPPDQHEPSRPPQIQGVLPSSEEAGARE